MRDGGSSRVWRALSVWGACVLLGAIMLPAAGATSAVRADASVTPTAPRHAASVKSLELPRDATLYVSGTATAPPKAFNPLDPGSSYTGTQGLLYEPLFLYDPGTGQLIDWLAAGAKWLGPRTYQLNVRPGVDWVRSAGASVVRTLTAADVEHSLQIARQSPDNPYHDDVSDVSHVVASGQSLTVTFDNHVNYATWQDYLWHAPVVWPGVAQANTAPVATGPMVLFAVAGNGACYQVNPHWWGLAALHLRFSFHYLCDMVTGDSGAQLSGLLGGQIDWSNALLLGVPNLAGAHERGYGFKTYYPGPPYMLPAATAWLEMDTSRAPMDNVYFRRAVAAAVSGQTVANDAYMGTVRVAGPTGLLPNLSSYIDNAVVKKDAIHHSLSDAKKLLDKSGYRGQDLTLQVQRGWPDMASAAAVITKQLRSAGVRVTVTTVSPARRQNDIANGHFDMVIDEDAGLSATPWDYFDRVFALPTGTAARSDLNTERFSDPSAWALVQQAGATPVSDTKQLDGIYGRLEADFLQQVPAVPVWFSGAWFEAGTTHWDGYPSSTSPRDRYTPVMSPGWLGSTTTVLALAQLQRS